MSGYGVRRTLVTVVMLVAPVGFTGCGGESDETGAETPTTLSSSDRDARDATAESDIQVDGDSDGSSVGDDFPIAAPDDLLLDAFEDAGVPQVNQRHLFYEDGDFDRVVMFYDDWTSQNGDWTKAEIDGSVTYVRVDDGGVGQIAVKPGFDPGAQADGAVTSVQLITG